LSALKIPRKSSPLIGQQLGQRGLAGSQRVGEDHLAHRVDAVALEEHVLGAGEADADGAERDRVAAVCSGVSALVRTCRRVACAHQLHQLGVALELLGLLRGLVVVERGRR
jgi:hypothetical protein